MCGLFDKPDVPKPDVPEPVDPLKAGLDESDEIARKRALAKSREKTVLTSAQGAADFGQNVVRQVQLVGQ